MILFAVGLSMMGFIIGLMSGISASPIVATLLPLLFALVTAGGNIYVIWGKGGPDELVLKTERNKRAIFLGIQLITFSMFFLPGLWLGVYAKFNPDTLWPSNKPNPVYSTFVDGNPAVFSLLRDYDYVLIGDGISFERRKEIIATLYKNRDQWKKDLISRQEKEPKGKVGGSGPGGFLTMPGHIPPVQKPALWD